MSTRRPIHRLALLVILLVICGTSAVTSAALLRSAGAGVPPSGTPDLSQMVPASSDFAPGARVTKQGYDLTFAGVGIIGYERKFSGVSSTGGARFAEVSSEATLVPNAETATMTFALLSAALRSPSVQQQSRARTIREYARRAHLRPGDIRFGSVRSLHVGDESVLLPWSVRVHGVLHRNYAILLRVDRVIGSLELTGVPRGTASFGEVAGLAGRMVTRIRAGLSPVSTVAPAIFGSATQGQTLVVTSGSWSNSPTSYAYQWERCDATGANCVPITGAAGQSYPLTAADAGATIRVSVTATNAIGSSIAATATPTTVVR
jgi:hypothetical protein